MADKVLTVLGVHGLGNQQGTGWEDKWAAAFTAAFPLPAGYSLQFEFVNYDDIFASADIDWYDCIKAAWQLGTSGIGSLFRRERGVLEDIQDKIKWTAGYVVAWCADEDFQRRSRQRVLEAIERVKPDIVMAHSLGSLITYNAFSHEDAQAEAIAAALKNVHYVTFGSQLGNPFVLNSLTNGRLQPLPVRFWHHLYNPRDMVFTAEIRLWDMTQFRQTITEFSDDDFPHHTAERYIGLPATVANVWAVIASGPDGAKTLTPPIRPLGIPAKRRGKPQIQRQSRKALLVGINDYPSPEQRLEGCLNDVFTMSAVLQDCGFPADSIRVCLDDRATAAGILERLKWLLDDPQPGDELVFYYSGHGAQMPEYGLNFEPDRRIETLVPWDFDWTPERAIADNQIFNLYSQLPYDTRLMLIFDCCHSGGIHRAGGPKPRGISPPDDIRHREIRWDGELQMWVPRDFNPLNRNFAPKSEEKRKVAYFGRDGATERIGRAGMLRRKVDSREYQQLKREVSDDKQKRTQLGPYLPLIIEACGEGELSYEYRHGVTSHGAFTFVLDRMLREAREITFEQLVERARDRLEDLQFDQTPQLLGPTAYMASQVPFRIPASRGGPSDA